MCIVPNRNSVNQLLPEVNELLPEVNQLLPDVNQLLPDVNELLPDVNQLLPSIKARFVRLVIHACRKGEAINLRSLELFEPIKVD